MKALVVPILLMTMLGSCGAPPERHTDSIVRAAADHVARKNEPVSYTETDGLSRGMLSFPAIPYASGADLIEKNPGCCGLGILAAGEDVPPTCSSLGHRTVTVAYKKRYRGEKGEDFSQHDVEYVGVRADGSICGDDP